MTKTHRQTGWTRTPLADGSMCYTITPTDGSGDRVVRFLSAHSWQNDPNDNRDNIDTDRAVLISGEPLPDWAQVWLAIVAKKWASGGRAEMRRQLDDADMYQDLRAAWDY